MNSNNYEKMLDRAWELMDAKPNSIEELELISIAKQIEEYEDELFVMEFEVPKVTVIMEYKNHKKTMIFNCPTIIQINQHDNIELDLSESPLYDFYVQGHQNETQKEKL